MSSSEAGEVEKRRRTSLESFIATKILRHDTWGRATAILGSFTLDPDGTTLEIPTKAIVIVRQDAFDVTSVCATGKSTEGEGKEGEKASLTLLDMLPQPSSLALEKANDVYSYYKMKMVDVSSSQRESTAVAAMTNIRIDIIEPAGWFDIKKYIAKQIVTVIETPELFEKCTRPYLASIEAKEIKRCKWVYNILDGMCMRMGD